MDRTPRESAATVVRWGLVVGMLSTLPMNASAEQPLAKSQPRAAWTTSQISGSPEPPLPYTTERAFPSLTFNRCLELTAAPGSDRIFVVEERGKVFSFPNRSDVESADLVIDLAKAIPGVSRVYSLTFHPDFETNRYCYVCYIKKVGEPDGTHVARFKMTDADPPTIDVASETTLLTWLSGGHNGCCLKFGPDGCLYISTGDGGPANPPDPKHAGQDISNLLSSILRIDVDQQTADRNYQIPPDNPFVDLAGARGEVWAYGLRNPWRMSFDSETGDLWVGDVGWELWEMLNRVERGGNYGWSVLEGSHPSNPERKRGPTPILPPTIEHSHTESSSITDGLTYHGSRLPELRGTHIYGDYDTGKIWGFRFEAGQVVEHRELADTTHRIVSFGEDNNNAMYLLDHTAGTIHRLVANRPSEQPSRFPRKLSETGLFDSVVDQTPMPGVIPYSISAQPWADHAVAQRFVAVPGSEMIEPKPKTWAFPTGTVLVKTLSLDMEHGNPATRQHVETQILHYDGIDWLPYTYAWNQQQTDATLVPSDGDQRAFEIVDPASPGGLRNQTWRFAGRAECQRCHNSWSGPPLGFNSLQLNCDLDIGDAHVSQLDRLAEIGLLDKPIDPQDRESLVDPSDTSAETAPRARAYLQANCAHCHRQHAGGAVLSKMHSDVPLSETNMLDARPSQGTFGIHSAHVITPGDPLRSVLWYRMAKLGSGRMPHIGSSEVDVAGLELIGDWIDQLPPSESSSDAAALRRQSDALAALAELEQSAETETDAEASLEKLLSTTEGGLLLMRSLQQKTLPEAVASLTIARAAKHPDAGIRDLFERFLPADQRVERLGNVVATDQILALSGDADRGRLVFFETAGVSCKNCHRIGEAGTAVGPDLTTIGKKLSAAELLESILEPSKRIDAPYLTYLLETIDGRVLSGLLIGKDDNHMTLREATGTVVVVAADDIEQLVPQRKSLMPELLVRDLTSQQVADLLSYLISLK
ncbi:Soluble aldose sugar dehydrogenase YliI precursor [Rosistilla oblonga]|uniref:PQQ-dependent sugar dehydrogenase n=1 Tax=Rosistilla oblonga TaxID=2527990 RepID=UPI00118B63C9|nr:PQQ-dependent sugar dehydrogenase [Rosistilla oblonga]QDV14364.1 Soluble aldose sugar dehydrogenase YliI precursor [Rosistilla oblonga]